MFKKIITLLITVSIMVSAFVIPVNAAITNIADITVGSERVTSKDGLWQYFEYNMSAYTSGYCVCDYLGTETDITLPEEIDGIKINSVSITNNKIEHITIPVTYVVFGLGCLGDCTNLKTVTFSREYEVSQIRYFGDMMFVGDKKLESVVLPNDISYKSNASFSEPNTTFPSDTFLNCKKLKSVVFPEGIKKIGYDCFKGCSSLEEIVIPEGVEIIEEGAFDKCTSLKTFVLPSTINDPNFGVYGFGTSDTIFVINNEYLLEWFNERSNDFSYISEMPTDVIGDVNGDGILNISDVTVLQKSIADIYKFAISNADYDGNGYVNINDATLIQKTLAYM